MSAEVIGMLGQYTHRLTFSGDESPFKIIYGPNGVGKTKFLELISAMVGLDPYAVAGIPFTEATLSFEDGTIFRVVRVGPENPAERVDVIFYLDSPQVPTTMNWAHSNLDKSGRSDFERMLERETMWREIRPGWWQDQSDEEIIELSELRRRFPPSRSRHIAQDAPEELRALTTTHRAHLIETQRLNNYHNSSPVRAPRDRAASRRSTVSNFAVALRSELQRVQAQNSRASQQLERTFPRRVLEEKAQIPKNVVDIRTKYDEQNEFRKRLGSIGLIANDMDFPLPDRDLQNWETSVLWIYLTDTDKKLITFEPILQKIETFTSVINRRFLGKIIRVSAEEGLIIESLRDGSRLDADALSSGEQHELILMYDLTFNVRGGSIVMIDEPEISLHVSWQLEFLRDVSEIAKLSDFQFIVATHSPQIIADNWDEAVAFGPEGVDFA
nr:AAA family ATPase [Clavibacter michiganensis]